MENIKPEIVIWPAMKTEQPAIFFSWGKPWSWLGTQHMVYVCISWIGLHQIVCIADMYVIGRAIPHCLYISIIGLHHVVYSLEFH